MWRRSLTLAGTLVFALLASSCSATTVGNGSPETTTPTKHPRFISPNLPQAGAPKVEEPLADVQYFLDHPCATLTSEQTTSLGLPAEGVQHLSAGQACSWSNTQTSASVGVTWETGNPKGLTAIYERKTDYDLFGLQDPIEGLPVLLHDLKIRRNIGSCLVNVGATDDLTVQVSLSLARDKVGSIDPCNAVHDVATMMVTTVKRGPHA